MNVVKYTVDIYNNKKFQGREKVKVNFGTAGLSEHYTIIDKAVELFCKIKNITFDGDYEIVSCDK